MCSATETALARGTFATNIDLGTIAHIYIVYAIPVCCINCKFRHPSIIVLSILPKPFTLMIHHEICDVFSYQYLALLLPSMNQERLVFELYLQPIRYLPSL